MLSAQRHLPNSGTFFSIGSSLEQNITIALAITTVNRKQNALVLSNYRGDDIRRWMFRVQKIYPNRPTAEGAVKNS